MRFALALMLILLPAFALGHGFGASLEATSQGLRIDVGYDPAEPVAGQRVVFDFELYENELKENSISYDRVWARLHAGSDTLLATGVGKSDLGPTTLLMRLPNPVPEGLQMTVRYEKEGNTVAEHEFPFPVRPAPKPAVPLPVLTGLLGACAGAALAGGLLYRRKRSPLRS